MCSAVALLPCRTCIWYLVHGVHVYRALLRQDFSTNTIFYFLIAVQPHQLKGNIHYKYTYQLLRSTSYTRIDDEADLSEPHEVKAIFGEIGQDTQGPAGAPVPEEGENPEFMELEDEHDVEYRYSDDPEAPEDAIGKIKEIVVIFLQGRGYFPVVL